MTQSGESTEQELLVHAQRQTKAVEGIYNLLIVFAVLTGVGALLLILNVYAG